MGKPTSPVAPEQVVAAGWKLVPVDAERALFEATMAVRSPGCDFHCFNKDNYSNRAVHNSWDGWMARAALAQPAPSVPDLANLQAAYAPCVLEQEWTEDHSRNYPNKAASIINAVRALLVAAQPAPVQAGAQQAAGREPFVEWQWKFANKHGRNPTAEDAYAAPTQAGAGDAKGGA